MKKLLQFMLCIVMVFALCAAASAATYTPGTYTGAGQGFAPLTVTLEVDENGITAVTADVSGETAGFGADHQAEFEAAVMAAQGADFDTVASCSLTTAGVKEAVKAALNEAAGVKEADAYMADGTYTATAASYAELYGLATTGSMTMTATVKDGKFESITIDESTDTDIIGGMAFPILIDEVLTSQSLAVDSVSGATVSSNGFFTAIKDIVVQAGGSIATYSKPVEKPTAVATTYDCDVLVIGAGMAGLTAATEAAEAGASVILLEKNNVYSSSTTRSVGYVVGAETALQKANGIEDTEEALYNAYVELYGDEEAIDLDLLKVLAYNSSELNEWLVGHGVEFQDVICKSVKGCRAVPRIHTTTGGSAVSSPLAASAAAAGVQIMMGTPAVSLIQAENGAVVGAKATNANGDDITVNAQATIVCAGSYTDNPELFAELNPRINNIAYACGSGVGDAWNWFKAVGADCIEIPYTQFMYYCYAANFPEFPEVIPNSPDAPVSDVLFVTGGAERVTAEDNFCFEFTKENWIRGYNEGYCIVDQTFADTYPILMNDVLTCTVPATGLPFAYKGETVAELAEAVGLDAATLEATVARYNELCDQGEDVDFGKDAQYMRKLEGTLYIIRLPQITTDGYSGARINENAQVISTDGNPIPGLYAAGSCADSQVTSVNYYGCGTSLLTCGVFGRAAAQHAVANLVK